MLINNIRKSPTCPIRNTIHAPTRGATSAVAWKWKLHIISIHAPTRGATAYVRKTGLGRDISIHAPTRGATTWSDWSGQTKETFQSTLLQEERPYRAKDGAELDNFNPRSYKRSDYGSRQRDGYTEISIHAPTRGATFNILGIIRYSKFQSTLLQEERR